MNKHIERPDGYWRYEGNTVSIEWDPSRPDDWYHIAGNVVFSSEFPEGREIPRHLRVQGHLYRRHEAAQMYSDVDMVQTWSEMVSAMWDRLLASLPEDLTGQPKQLAGQIDEMLTNLLAVSKRLKKAGAPKSARVVEAGWWAVDPMGGDGPLDILIEVERASEPEAAADIVEAYLTPNPDSWDDGADSYGAMGVWLLVMTTGPQEYRDEFKGLGRVVRQRAKQLLADEEFMESWGGSVEEPGEVGPWLEAFAAGKGHGKLGYNDPFTPKGEDAWYIADVDATTTGSGVTVTLKLRNDGLENYEDSEMDEDIYLDAPEGADIDSATAQNYGGQGSDQQSALIEIQGEDEEGEYQSWDMQIDVDSKTGEPNVSGEWGEA